MPPMTPTGAFNVIVATVPGIPFISVSPHDVGGLRTEERQHLQQSGLGGAQPRDRSTHVHGLDLDQLLESFVEEVGDAHEQRLALVWGPGAPVALERPASSLDRAMDVSLVVEAASWASASPVDGLTVVRVRPEAAGTR